MSNHEGKGDATLDRAWRQASDEQPPAQLDAVIIASARKAVQDRDDAAKVTRTGRRSRNWLTGWQPLAAAAGVAGLAFVLVQSLPPDGDVAPATWIEEPVSGPIGKPESLPTPSAGQAKEEKAAAAPAPASALDEKSSVGGSAVMRAAEVDQRQATVPELSSQAVSEAAAAPAQERGTATPMSPEEWVARVVALYTSGEVAGAADALRAFRLADPDADTYVPESLLSWARTVE